MILDIDDRYSEETRAYEDRTRGRHRARSNAPALAKQASGVSIVFAHLSQRNIEGMLRGTIIAMVLISLILVGVFRSVRLGLVSLVPNFLPAEMSFWLWGYLVGRVGLSGSVIVTIAFGIIMTTIIVSLAFDCVDAARYLLGERAPVNIPTAG